MGFVPGMQGLTSENQLMGYTIYKSKSKRMVRGGIHHMISSIGAKIWNRTLLCMRQMVQNFLLIMNSYETLSYLV